MWAFSFGMVASHLFEVTFSATTKPFTEPILYENILYLFVYLIHPNTHTHSDTLYITHTVTHSTATHANTTQN